MPGLTEIWAKMGVDTASVPADLNKAKTAFNQFGQQVQEDSAKHGSSSGSKFTNAFEHRVLGARHLSGALATALGLNIEHIGESIAAAYVGGTEKAWQELVKLADENAKLIEKRLELALTPKQLATKLQKDSTNAAKEAQGAGRATAAESFIDKNSPTQAFKDNITRLGQLFHIVRSEAEKALVVQQAEHTSLEADVRLEERKKQVKESHHKLAEFEADMVLKTLSGGELIGALEERKKAVQEEINSGKLDEIEIDERKKKFDELSVQIAAEKNKLIQEGINKEKELLKLRMSLVEAQRKLAKDEEELANKKADRGKETVDEIANLKPGQSGSQFSESTHVDTFGLSAEAAAAKEQAVEIQRLQKQAESLRTSGDVGGANSLFDQIGTKKQGLVDSGFAKSTEGDGLKHLEESIHHDNVEVTKVLREIDTTLQGQHKNSK